MTESRPSRDGSIGFAGPSRENAAGFPGSRLDGFVGRSRELDLLGAGLAEALAGRARAFLLVGDAGIGKTRLAEELVARARLPVDRVLWGRSPEDRECP